MAETISLGGLERSYKTHLPSGYTEKTPAPLVVALHGAGGRGERLERVTRFNEISEREGFIVAYPDGIDGRWNNGRAIAEPEQQVDDVGFIVAVIEKIVSDYNIDEQRIYVVGVSHGAMMAYRIACEIPDRIAAIGAVIGALPEDITPSCAPSRPLPVLAMNGIADPWVPWESGEIRARGKKLGRVKSVRETIDFWIEHNRCSPDPVVKWEPDIDPDDGIRVRREEYLGGREGSEVILYTVEGAGHTWPGGIQYLPENVIGKLSKDIDAAEEIWKFFTRHRRQ